MFIFIKKGVSKVIQSLYIPEILMDKHPWVLYRSKKFFIYQTDPMNDAYLIDTILREIEKALQWEKVALWTDNDYKRLSVLIFEKTAISISPQTLKRLFGKVKYKEIYTPQPATRDALAMFLGYRDWQAYISKKR